MKLNKRRQFAQAALFSLVALSVSTAFAESVAQFNASLQASDRQLASIEQLFTRIEAANLPAEKEKLSDGLSKPLAEYANGMIKSFDTALKQAELTAKTQGKEGSTALVKPFEDLAKRHEQRMKQLDGRAQKIGGDIEKGEVETKKSGSIAEPAESAKAAHGWPMLEKVSDFFISPAQAALAIPVVAACGPLVLTVGVLHSALQACVVSVANASTAGAQAVNQFNACWGAAHRHKKLKDGHIHVPALMHTACTATLIQKLA